MKKQTKNTKKATSKQTRATKAKPGKGDIVLTVGKDCIITLHFADGSNHTCVGPIKGVDKLISEFAKEFDLLGASIDLGGPCPCCAR